MEEVSKVLNEFSYKIDRELKTLKTQLEISKNETYYFKTLLEDKDKTQDNNTLYILEDVTEWEKDVTEGENVTITYSLGIYSLESLALKYLLYLKSKGSKYYNSLHIHKIKLKKPYTKESKFYNLCQDVNYDYPTLKGIEVDNEVYSISDVEVDISLVDKHEVVIDNVWYENNKPI